MIEASDSNINIPQWLSNNSLSSKKGCEYVCVCTYSHPLNHPEYIYSGITNT